MLLVGDASADPRNYLGYGDFDFVPTKLIHNEVIETASDDWFVDFNGDGLPEMAMGRIPVSQCQEATTVITKILGYEQPGAGDWTKEVVLVADKAMTLISRRRVQQVGSIAARRDITGQDNLPESFCQR